MSEEFQLWQDFINYNVRVSKETPFSLQEKIDENAPLCGEDLLIATTNYRDTLVSFDDYQKVMNKGASSTALIACKFIYSKFGRLHFWTIKLEEKMPIFATLNKMVILAAEKNDFRSLEYRIQTTLGLSLNKIEALLEDFKKRCERPLAPITASLAVIEEDFQKKSELYDQALEQYKQAGKLAPINTLMENVEAKKDLLIKQYSELEDVNTKILSKQIDDYLTQIIEILKSKEIDPSFSIYKNKKRLASNWMHVAIIKYELKKFNSANNLQDQDINECVNQALAYPDEITIKLMRNAAILTENLGRLKKAAEIYQQIYSKFSDELAKDKRLKQEIDTSYQWLKFNLNKKELEMKIFNLD